MQKSHPTQSVPPIAIVSSPLTPKCSCRRLFNDRKRPGRRVIRRKSIGSRITCSLPSEKRQPGTTIRTIKLSDFARKSFCHFSDWQLPPIVLSFVFFSLGLGFKVSSAKPFFARFASISLPSSSQASSTADDENRCEVIKSGLHSKEKAHLQKSETDDKQQENSVQMHSASIPQNTVLPNNDCSPVSSENNHGLESSNLENEFLQDEELQKAFEEWKSKPYSLTVPLRIVALLDSIPHAWIKDFIQAQGKRLKMQAEFRGSLESIFSVLSSPLKKGKLSSQSIMGADLVTIGDSWLELAIKSEVIEPIRDARHQDWFNRLNERWKAYLSRDHSGHISSSGEIWAAPYRWGCMAVAYRSDLFAKNKIPPFEDWKDLWHPKLQGKISMVDDPREVIGAVLKYLGASYNANDFDRDVCGGKKAVKENFHALQRQVLLFDRKYYLKAFEAGDVWVAVGWTDSLIPAAKRMSNVAVVVPESGSSLWADLWAIPASNRIQSKKFGGRVRGPSPLIHQWLDFCLQPARSVPFELSAFTGASPLCLTANNVNVIESSPKSEVSESVLQASTERRTALQFHSNVVSGMPPPEILSKCEFLEPISSATYKDYEWVLARPVEDKQSWYNLVVRATKRIRATLTVVSGKGRI
eukprot:TRINITY_DN4367_c0_g1_i1.p1 TRINITY_DN4367_c0_g1~~TRINITY_DN4367_c0_g1_i1.p1  ORF type:complete len:640 (-),score=123.91 TRINITY_DN4367_c0_g1_i1:379-2298(-)